MTKRTTKETEEKKHSRFSPSGAERWFNCPGSVTLSEGLPDRETIYSKEGTKAHSVLESMLQTLNNRYMSSAVFFRGLHSLYSHVDDKEMVRICNDAAQFIFKQFAHSADDAHLLYETKAHLPFIHPDMFGSFDAAIIEYFGTLHIFDFKYGAGVAVSAVQNLQMISYALGMAFMHEWNFKKARLWIIQPRIKGYDGPTFWDLSIKDLKKYIPEFEKAVDRVERFPQEYREGAWCHFCKANQICPLKQEAKFDKAKAVFSPISKEK